MSKLIQVRNAPRHLKRELVNRAKARGQTLTDYIRESLEREVARPPTDEVFGRIARRPKVILGRPAAAITRQERAAGRPQLWPSWETVGIHMIGPHATELVAKAMPIAGWEAMPAEVTAMIRAHSTISEGLGEALLALQGKPLTPPDDVLRPGPSRDQPTMSGAQLEPAAQEQAPPQAASIEVPGHGGSYYLFKDIDNAEAERFCSGLWAGANFLSRVPDSRITVYINSGGGSVGAGFAMIEMLYKIKRELQIPVDTVILGYAYSMGANVFQAGDHRRMGYFSTMMLHSASWQVSGRDSEVFRDLKKLSDLYQRMSAELFYRRTGLHSSAWWRRFIYSGKERYLSAQECLELGLVDEVCEFLDDCYITSPMLAIRESPGKS